MGNELTFDPAAPGTPSPVNVLSNPSYAVQVDCPTVHECVATGASYDTGHWHDQEVTFDPTSPGTPSPFSLTDNASPSAAALSCPSSTQCTEVEGGYELTFDPQAPQTSTPVRIAEDQLMNVACPSTDQCTAAGGAGTVATFDPTAPSAPPQTRVAQALLAIACPLATQCTAVGDSEEATFDPTTSARPAMLPVGNGEEGFYAVACPASDECVGASTSEHAVIFNPLSPDTTTGGFKVGHTGNSEGLSCPSTTVCAVVSQLGLTVFDPTNPGSPSPVSIDNSNLLEAVACPAVTQCTAVDQGGAEVTFDPASPNGNNKATIDSEHQLNGVACPSTTECVAVDYSGQEVTFNPTAVGSPTPAVVDYCGPECGNPPLVSVACPSATQCTAIDDLSNEITFNPASPGTPDAVSLAPPSDPYSAQLNGIECLSTSACVAVDTSADYAGDAIAFNPATGEVTAQPTYLSTYPLEAIACPSTSQCTANDGVGNEVTYDPTTPPSLAVAVDDPGLLVAVSCAAATQCTALDRSGQETTFNPASPGQVSVASVTAAGAAANISCPTLHVCVVASVTGHVTAFDPAFPAQTLVKNFASGLTGIACASGKQCTALAPDSRAITFNAAALATGRKTVQWQTGASSAISCPGVTLCVAVGGHRVVVFNPQKTTAPKQRLLESDGLTAVACPTMTSCTALDVFGYAWTFDPASALPHLGATLADLLFPPDEAGDVIACASPALCITIEGGVAVSLNVRTARVKAVSIAGAGSLTAVACAGTMCTAVDDKGQAASAVTSGPFPSCTFSAGMLRPPAHESAPGTVKLRVRCVGYASLKITGSLTREVSGKHQDFRVAPIHGSAPRSRTVSFTAKLPSSAFAPAKRLKLTCHFELAATNGSGTTTLSATSSR